MDGDRYALSRFVQAQARDFDTALAELRAGRKRSHWMWYVFPQLAGLGRSGAARYYALSGLDEARAYWAHPVLGPRLRRATEALLACTDDDPASILGAVDALKLRSCMTLFEQAAPGEACFTRALERFHGGQRDPLTLGLLRGAAG